MDEKYRLIFRGEVKDGQHPAVVKRRLMKALNLDDSQAAKLFSGKPVVLQKEADSTTASRLESLFSEAGGRLLLKPLTERTTSGKQSIAKSSNPASEEIAQLTVQAEYVEPPAREVAEIAAPDFDVLEVGSVLADPTPEPVAVVKDVAFQIAEVGVDLLTEPATAVIEVDLGALDFEIAEVGADIDTRPSEQPPPAPDTSHMKLA